MNLGASIVVPAYNEEDSISEALDSMRGQDAEVIVVVGGEDGTKEIAEAHSATDKVLEDEKESGPGPARNQGAEEASNEIVLFTDAETKVQENWVENHRRHYSEERVVGVGGPVKPWSDSLKHKILFKILSDYFYRVSWLVGFVAISGWNGSYRREEFLEEGGFNEELSFMEDTELSLRMKKYGKIVYDKECWTKTSVRRQEGQGYIPLFMQYAKAYFNYYVLDADLGSEYFTSSEEVDEEEKFAETLS